MINIVCPTFQNKHDRIFRCSTITKTPRAKAYIGRGCDKKAGASRVQEEYKSSRLQEGKRQSNIIDCLFINMYSIVLKNILCIAVQ